MRCGIRYLWISAATLLVGFSCGITLTWAPLAADVTPSRLVVAEPTGRQPCVARHLSDLQASEAATTALREKLRALHAEEIAIIGEPIDFPDDLPAAYSADGAERTLAAALVDSPFEAVAMSCDEYPCLALVEWTRADLSGEDLWALLESAGVGASMPEVGGYGDASGRTWQRATVLLHPSLPTSASLDRRRAFRAGNLAEQLPSRSDAGGP